MKRIAIIGGFVLLGLIILITGIRIYGHSPDRRMFDIHGSIKNVADGKPMAGMIVRVNNREVVTNKDGSFAFTGVPEGAVLTVSGAGLYGDMVFTITDDKPLNIYVDVSAEQFLIKLRELYKYRKFGAAYDLLTSEYADKISLEDFVASENRYFDDILHVDSPNPCQIENVVFEDRKYDPAGTSMDADMIFYLSGACEGVRRYARRVIVVGNGDTYSWQYAP